MGKGLKEKELGVGIGKRDDGFYVGRFTTKMGNGNRKYSVNYKRADNDCQIQSIRTSIVI